MRVPGSQARVCPENRGWPRPASWPYGKLPHGRSAADYSWSQHITVSQVLPIVGLSGAHRTAISGPRPTLPWLGFQKAVQSLGDHQCGIGAGEGGSFGDDLFQHTAAGAEPLADDLGDLSRLAGVGTCLVV